jgi:hypothetical protein
MLESFELLVTTETLHKLARAAGVDATQFPTVNTPLTAR